MERRAFHAMGTRGRAAAGRRAERRERATLSRGPSASSSGWSAALALPPRLRALGAQPRRRARRRRRPRRRHAARPRGARAHRRPLRPHRPRRARRRRLRPHVRRGRPGRPCAAAPRRCGGAVRIDGRRIELEPGFRLDLGGIAKGYAVDRAAASSSAAGPVPRQRGRRPRRPRPALAGRRRDAPTAQITLGLEHGALATSGRDRRRWRRDGAEAHHLIDPATGLPADGDFLRVTVVAPHGGRGRGARQGGLPRRARRTGRPCSSRPTAGRCSPGASHEDRPDLLAARARERADRLRAADELGRSPGLTVKSKPLGARIKAAVVDRPAPVPLAARPRRGRAARARADARPDRPDAARRPARPRSQPLPAARDRHRRARGRADGPHLRLVLAPPPDRRAELAPAALPDLRGVRRRHRPRPRRRHRPVGVRALRGLGRRRRRPDGVASPDHERRNHDVPHRNRPVAV